MESVNDHRQLQGSVGTEQVVDGNAAHQHYNEAREYIKIGMVFEKDQPFKIISFLCVIYYPVSYQSQQMYC